MPHNKIHHITRGLLTWFAENARDLPWRRTRHPYAIWVSEIMLQQTLVKTVIPYWERWMLELPNIRALAKADSSKLHKLWEGLGYYTRVRNMQKAARIIIKDHGGVFPENFTDILALPGIGRYTAGAICSIAFNQPYPVLDGNVIRVLARVFGVKGDPRETRTNALLWSLAEELVGNAIDLIPPIMPTPTAKPNRDFAASNLNQSLMELGALICTARDPRCQLCPIATVCVAVKQGRAQELPTASPRPRITKRRVAAFLLEREGRFLVRQRAGDTVNANLWEFPNIELTSELHDLRKAAKKELRATPVLEPFCTIRHSITRFRITLEVYRAVLPDGNALPAPSGSRWLSPAALQQLPFASAHKKILIKLEAHKQPLPESDGFWPAQKPIM